MLYILKKRGQSVSFYVIFGVIILAVFFFLMMFSKNLVARPLSFEVDDVDSLRAFVNSCVQTVGEKALFIVGRQGGYTINAPLETLDTPYGNIGYIFKDGKKTAMTSDAIKKEIGLYVKKELPACLSDFSGFNDKEIDIKPRNIKADAVFGKTDTIVIVDCPMSVKTGDHTVQLESFQARFNVRIKEFIDVTDILADRMTLNPGYIDLTYLGNLDMNSTILTEKDGQHVIVLEDYKSSLGGKIYKYLFVISK